MKRLIRNLLRLLLFSGVLASGVALWLIHGPGSRLPVLAPVDEVVYLEQGWGRAADAAPRQVYSFTPTGAGLHGMRYDWLVHLEEPWGRARFTSPERMRAYGFVVDLQPTAANPDLLPVGFVRRYDPRLGESVADVSCASCHTGQLVFERAGRRTALRVDGGPANHWISGAGSGQFVPSLTAAVASTYLNPLKFSRFARAVLGERYDAGKWKLHKDLGEVLAGLLTELRRARQRTGVEDGPGRSDMLARMAHRALSEPLGETPGALADAPVRYPALWNSWKLEANRAAASASQPMALAISHALGSGAQLALLDGYGRPVPAAERFRSSVQVDGLHRIHSVLELLSPPRWPEDVLGPVDAAKAERGRVLFEQHCVRCHEPVAAPRATVELLSPLRTPLDPLWQATLVAVDVVGTDPAAAAAAAERTIDLGAAGLSADDVREAFRPALVELRRRVAALEARDTGARVAPEAPAGDVNPAAAPEVALVRQRLRDAEQLLSRLDVHRVPVTVALGAVGALARAHFDSERGFSPEQRACLDGFGRLELPRIEAAYVARPLAGAWATGPYLHNGSVPTLYQLLSPRSERDSRFFVSPGAFDTEQVGIDTKAKGDGFWFDTGLPGNTNVGHEFRAGYSGAIDPQDPQYGVIGPALSPEERWALVEYLKLHADAETPSGRVSPGCGLR